jgi:hypothetical protein
MEKIDVREWILTGIKKGNRVVSDMLDNWRNNNDFSPCRTQILEELERDLKSDRRIEVTLPLMLIGFIFLGILAVLQISGRSIHPFVGVPALVWFMVLVVTFLRNIGEYVCEGTKELLRAIEFIATNELFTRATTIEEMRLVSVLQLRTHATTLQFRQLRDPNHPDRETERAEFARLVKIQSKLTNIPRNAGLYFS